MSSSFAGLSFSIVSQEAHGQRLHVEIDAENPIRAPIQGAYLTIACRSVTGTPLELRAVVSSPEGRKQARRVADAHSAGTAFDLASGFPGNETVRLSLDIDAGEAIASGSCAEPVLRGAW